MAGRKQHPRPGRIIDVWHGGDERDPAAVVAQHWSRAPERVRRKVRPLTETERRLWCHLADRDWMQTEVYTQIPVYAPEVDFGCVVGFLVPRIGIAIEVECAWGGDTGEQADDRARDFLLETHLEIATMRLPEAGVARDPRWYAEAIRWDLGLTDHPPEGCYAVNLPRSQV